MHFLQPLQSPGHSYWTGLSGRALAGLRYSPRSDLPRRVRTLPPPAGEPQHAPLKSVTTN